MVLRIHTHVREDTLALFGFATAEEKLVFERLISVSGIGPSLAVKVLFRHGDSGTRGGNSGPAMWCRWCAYQG